MVTFKVTLRKVRNLGKYILELGPLRWQNRGMYSGLGS